MLEKVEYPIQRTNKNDYSILKSNPPAPFRNGMRGGRPLVANLPARAFLPKYP
jgi:hypothetical protein